MEQLVTRRSKRIKKRNSLPNDNNHDEEEEEEEEEAQRFMSTITDDLLEEILLRLPHPRYVVRCTAVCKRWSSLIRTPRFALEFSRRCRAFELLFQFKNLSKKCIDSNVYLLGGLGESNQVFSSSIHCLNFLPLPNEISVLASSSTGLLLTYLLRGLCVCNSMTKETLFLPGPNPQWPHSRFGLIANMDSLGHFKIVALDQSFIRNQHQKSHVRVFCSLTRNWSHSLLCESSPMTLEHPCHEDGIAGNGVLYFPVMDTFYHAGIFEFSPFKTDGEDQSRLIDMPDGFREGWRASKGKSCLGVVRGRLRVSQMLKSNGAFDLRIWELGPESWELVYDVGLKKRRDTNMFVVAFDPYDDNVIFVVRDGLSIWKYKIVGGDGFMEDGKYERVGRLPILSNKLSKYDKTHIRDFMTVFVQVRSSLPSKLAL